MLRSHTSIDQLNLGAATTSGVQAGKVGVIVAVAVAGVPVIALMKARIRNDIVDDDRRGQHARDSLLGRSRDTPV